VEGSIRTKISKNWLRVLKKRVELQLGKGGKEEDHRFSSSEMGEKKTKGETKDFSDRRGLSQSRVIPQGGGRGSTATSEKKL